ncbi:MAG TPA: TPM domain-containing protein [Crocinitomix sp.]|nr:TPM domain-containing protein [Crocinitomix sp.]
MKNIKYQILLILICFTRGSFGQSLPKPIGFVNDFENIFTDKQEHILDSLVKNFEKQTTIQIAIVTLDSSYTNKSEFDNYTFKLANNWGVGQKDKNNGVLIGISSSLRKMRIQNGYGIEIILTDEESKEIIDNQFIPYFKENEYFKGTKVGLLKLFEKLTSNELKSEIQNIAGVKWIVKINDSLEFSHPYLKKGEYISTLTINSENDTIKFLLYTSSDSTFENEITEYHMLASCSLSKENYKFKTYKNLNYFLFLPSYPCWNNGYSENGKEMIRKMFKK